MFKKIIDVQSQVFPKAYAELICKNKKIVTGEKVSESKYILNYFDGMYKFNIDMNKYDPNYIIQKMDESNIDISLISVNIPTPDLLDPELRSDGAIICNNYIAETCSAYPNRFYGLANIAPND